MTMDILQMCKGRSLGASQAYIFILTLAVLQTQAQAQQNTTESSSGNELSTGDKPQDAPPVTVSLQSEPKCCMDADCQRFCNNKCTQRGCLPGTQNEVLDQSNDIKDQCCSTGGNFESTSSSGGLGIVNGTTDVADTPTSVRGQQSDLKTFTSASPSNGATTKKNDDDEHTIDVMLGLLVLILCLLLVSIFVYTKKHLERGQRSQLRGGNTSHDTVIEIKEEDRNLRDETSRDLDPVTRALRDPGHICSVSYRNHGIAESVDSLSNVPSRADIGIQFPADQERVASGGHSETTKVPRGTSASNPPKKQDLPEKPVTEVKAVNVLGNYNTTIIASTNYTTVTPTPSERTSQANKSATF